MSEGVVLLLQVPRTNDKKELAAEQMFASLYGLLLPNQKLSLKKIIGQRISLEIAVLNSKIGFYVWVPNNLKDFVEDQIYAQYPTVQISEVKDYSLASLDDFSNVIGAELFFETHQALPIKTFQNFEVDPLASITATLAKFKSNEQAWIQLVISPALSNWQRSSEKYIEQLNNSKSGSLVKTFASAFWVGSDQPKANNYKLSDFQQTKISGAEQKSQKLAYQASLRIIYIGKSTEHLGKLKLQSIMASYRQFNSTYLNGFNGRITQSRKFLNDFLNRKIAKKPLVLNIEELATLYHLPHTNVETPYILWSSYQTAEPPANLPLANSSSGYVSPIGTVNFRSHNLTFGLPRFDRSRHLYILGQTGVGKSALLELLTIADLSANFGLAVIDPHGDLALNILKRIPVERLNDVIYFNPADTEFPMAFNPMEVLDPKLKTHTASELIGVLKRMFDSWGPRLEYILRYTILALLDYENATMLDITRMLTDQKFRQQVVSSIQDSVVVHFWVNEFNSWNNRFAVEAVAPILNKVGAFTANPLVRNIIGQPKSSFNIRDIMDNRKILIVNLTRGLIGEDNAAVLGSLLVTKIQLAAMSRANINIKDRQPFYLYVDEFQNFATDSFATILSEARKYGLNLTVANQYIAQMSQDISDAIFGNVGSIVCFRMGADDAYKMQKYFQPSFNEADLINLNNRHFVISMTIEGEKARPFSAISIDLPTFNHDFSKQIIEHSRQLYASHKDKINDYIKAHYDQINNQENNTVIKNNVLTFNKNINLIEKDLEFNTPANVIKKRHRVRHRKNKTLSKDDLEINISNNQDDTKEHVFKIIR